MVSLKQVLAFALAAGFVSANPVPEGEAEFEPALWDDFGTIDSTGLEARGGDLCSFDNCPTEGIIDVYQAKWEHGGADTWKMRTGKTKSCGQCAAVGTNSDGVGHFKQCNSDIKAIFDFKKARGMLINQKDKKKAPLCFTLTSSGQTCGGAEFTKVNHWTVNKKVKCTW